MTVHIVVEAGNEIVDSVEITDTSVVEALRVESDLIIKYPGDEYKIYCKESLEN
ncbi:hypothetical protein BN1088_1431072 [Sphingobacterium sp. PM2-P1-29]|jgi:hypothetical protein|nr:hypothetical protein BN1088_1431072 [Sphingobacterium sp. PM2-P1-29]